MRPDSSTVGSRNTRVTNTATTRPEMKESTVNWLHSSIHSTTSHARNGSCTRDVPPEVTAGLGGTHPSTSPSSCTRLTGSSSTAPIRSHRA